VKYFQAAFISLAQNQQSSTAAIILSATGKNGILDIKKTNAMNALLLDHSDASAHFDNLSQSAINPGVVDQPLPPDEMLE